MSDVLEIEFLASPCSIVLGFNTGPMIACLFYKVRWDDMS